MYIPYGFQGAVSGALVTDDLLIWNTYGGYNSSTGIWADLSGNNNTGSVSGTLTDNSGSYGFDGINNSVFYGQSIPNILVFNLTISFMGTLAGRDANRWGWYAYDNFGAPAGFWQKILDASATPNDLEFRCTSGGGNQTNQVPDNYNPPEIAMYTITVKQDEIVFYKNSEILGIIPGLDDPYYVGPGFPSNPLYFGSDAAGTTPFSGSINNLLLYNRTLTQQEVASNYGYLASLL